MTRVLLNDVERGGDAPGQTWGALLDALDAQLTTTSQIVTAVRFDGLEEPAFRDPAVTARSLSEVGVVEIATGTSTDLITRSLGEASAAFTSLRADMARAGEAFRRYDVAVANTALVPLAGGLQTLLLIVQAVGLALRVDLTELQSQGQTASAMIDELSGFVDSLLAAQRSEDWIGVADVIEYDLEPALRRWQVMLDTLAAMAASSEYEVAS